MPRPGTAKDMVNRETARIERTAKDDMATGRTASQDDKPVGHSGWLIPLGIFLVTFVLSGLVLLFYLAPRPTGVEQILPTSLSDAVALHVRDLTLNIPSNYLQFESARQGGDRKDVALWGLFPDMVGYSAVNADSFTSDVPDSPAIYMLIREDTNNLSPADRLARIYMPYVTNTQGTRGPFGLTQYGFRDDSNYRSEDLFVGDTDKGPLMLVCGRLSQEVTSPSCLAIDRPIAKNVSLSYRFKRAHLARWQEINANVDKLISHFAGHK